MKSILMTALAGGVALTALSSCNSSQDADTAATTSDSKSTAVLRFSAIPDEDTTAQAERYQPVADYLSSKLGVKVQFVASPSYGASVKKFVGGDIQLAWFGGVSGVKARQGVKGAEAIVSGKADLAFKSYFIAHTSTGLTRSESFPTEIANKTFTYGSSGSTSGCIMPSHFIMENTSKSPQEFFQKGFGFSGSHDKTAELVNNGTYEVGALNFKTFDKGIASGKLDPSKCVVIWETPTYADYNMTAHPVLNEQFGDDFIAKLQEALVSCDDEKVLGALKRKQLVKVENSTFAGIASVMEKVNFKK